MTNAKSCSSNASAISAGCRDTRASGSDGGDDDSDPGSDHHRPDNTGLDGGNDDDSNNHDDDPGPHPDDKDNDGDDDDDDENDDSSNWQRELNLLRRRNSLEIGAENNQDDLLNDDQDPIDPADDIDQDVNMEDDTNDADESRFNHYDDRSPSPLFVPHSRENSPEGAVHPATGNDVLDDMSDIELDDISDKNIARRTRSPAMPDSPVQPKIEPKLEPEPEVMNHIGNTRSTRTYDLIDLTEDDESTRSGSSIMEVIELTEDSATNVPNSERTINRYEAMIDLTEDWDTSQDGLDMEVIDLDDD